MQQATLSRRSFMRGAVRPPKPVLRPPGISEASLSTCIGCADCVTACDENIIVLDAQQKPSLDFSQSGCSFCGDCAAACSHDVFAEVLPQAFEAEIALTEACLVNAKIACHICTDHCTDDALRFDLSQRPVGAIRIDAEACTGCGFCVSSCPADAIRVTPIATREAP